MVNGKLWRESTKIPDMKPAEAVLLQRRADVSEGKIPEPAKNYTFSALAGEYLKWAERQRVFPTKKIFVGQLVGVFGNIDLNSFGPKIIENWQTERLKRNSPATCNRVLSTLKHMLTKAVDWEMAKEDTLKKVRKVKLLEEPPGRLRYLSSEEYQALIEVCSPHLRPIVIIATHSGMRKGEILRLRWEQIDLGNGLIFLSDTKSNKRREVSINNTIGAILRNLPHGLESEYVFVDRNGMPFKDIKRSFATALKRAGIADFHFHDLRHTFASHARMGGAEMGDIKEQVGWTSWAMVQKYAHLAPEYRKKVVDAVEKHLTPGHKVKAVDTLDKNNGELHSYFTVEHGRS